MRDSSSSSTPIFGSRPRSRLRLWLGLLGIGIAISALAVTVTPPPAGTPEGAADGGTTGTNRISVALVLPLPTKSPVETAPALATVSRPANTPRTAAVPTPVKISSIPQPTAAPNRIPPDDAPGQPDPPPPAITAPPTGTWTHATVKRGDTLSAIFKRLSLSPVTLHQLLQADGLDRELQRIRPGEEIRVRTDGDRLLELAYAPDALSTLHVVSGGTGWTAETVATPVEIRTRFIGSIIEDSLYLSATEAGLDDRLIMELAGIFGWDVDFALDIRAGDRFGLMFEELYSADGEKLADGAILAASFTNRGKTFRAARYRDPGGDASYFSPDGYSMRKAFLRSPVDFRRISSRFRGSRYHPVLGKKRPHRGVDYAAATGTPIKASGDGKVVHAGRKGGYGKAVILQHGGRYRTLYAHMSRYARGIKNGKRVRQGQTIGYVGSTGLATGPHLHYEFLVDGVHRNPLTVKLPKADPIDPKQLPAFRAVAEPLLAQLAVHEQTLLAQNGQ